MHPIASALLVSTLLTNGSPIIPIEELDFSVSNSYTGTTQRSTTAVSDDMDGVVDVLATKMYSGALDQTGFVVLTRVGIAKLDTNDYKIDDVYLTITETSTITTYFGSTLPSESNSNNYTYRSINLTTFDISELGTRGIVQPTEPLYVPSIGHTQSGDDKIIETKVEKNNETFLLHRDIKADGVNNYAAVRYNDYSGAAFLARGQYTINASFQINVSASIWKKNWIGWGTSYTLTFPTINITVGN